MSAQSTRARRAAGSSSSTRRAAIAGQHQLEHRQILPRPGWVEHDPIEILKRTEEVIAGGMRNARVLAADLAAIGVTNQRETTVVWNPKTGEPWTNAIVWQDTRTDRIVAGLERDGHGAAIRRKTGLPPATYFSAPSSSGSWRTSMA